MYLLLILLGMIALLPYQRDVKIDEQLYGREFPLSMFSEGEEHWLYGYYRDKNREVGEKARGLASGTQSFPYWGKDSAVVISDGFI